MKIGNTNSAINSKPMVYDVPVMTPYEVVKESIDKMRLIEDLLSVVSDCDLLDTEDVENFYRNADRIINGSKIDNAWKALKLKGTLKSSQLSFLLSVKEMVIDNKRNYPMVDEPEWRKGYTEALEDIQSLLDTEINKIKEIS